MTEENFDSIVTVQNGYYDFGDFFTAVGGLIETEHAFYDYYN